MTKTTFTFTFATALTLALFSSPAQANKPTVDNSTSTGMRAVAEAFGDQNGQVRLADGTGGQQVLVQDLEGYSIYVGGDDVYVEGIFAWCYEDSVGGMSTCDIIGAPGSTEYYCSDEPDGDNWCECYDLADCLVLVLSDGCTEPLDCDGQACYCI